MDKDHLPPHQVTMLCKDEPPEWLIQHLHLKGAIGGFALLPQNNTGVNCWRGGTTGPTAGIWILREKGLLLLFLGLFCVQTTVARGTALTWASAYTTPAGKCPREKVAAAVCLSRSTGAASGRCSSGLSSQEGGARLEGTEWESPWGGLAGVFWA